MNTFIALLRGINIGGHKKIIMKDLKLHLQELGFQNIVTYIQSGNIIFNSKKTSEDLKLNIQDKIEQEYGFFVPALVISLEELNHIIKKSPYQKSNFEQKFISVSFLFDTVEGDRISELNKYTFGDDVFSFSDNAIFNYCPGGFAKTKITNNFFENKLKVTVTTRNWRTTLKLKEIADSLHI